jgi:hypothetical protein
VSIFVELAVQDSQRISDVWVNDGIEALVRAVTELDPAWLGVNLELVRRVRTDPDFRERIERRQEPFAPVNRARLERAQREGEIRADLGPSEIGAFVNLVLNGLALQRASGDEPPSVDLVVRLIEDAIGGPARSRTPSRTRS